MLQHQAARLVQKMLAAKHSDYLNKYSMDLTLHYLIEMFGISQLLIGIHKHPQII